MYKASTTDPVRFGGWKKNCYEDGMVVEHCQAPSGLHCIQSYLHHLSTFSLIMISSSCLSLLMYMIKYNLEFGISKKLPVFFLLLFEVIDD